MLKKVSELFTICPLQFNQSGNDNLKSPQNFHDILIIMATNLHQSENLKKNWVFDQIKDRFWNKKSNKLPTASRKKDYLILSKQVTQVKMV